MSPDKPAKIFADGEIVEKIFIIRGHKVMLDRDLAEMYDVPTSRLNEAVKRNKTRFPADFMFQLSAEEFKVLISQIAISKKLGRGGTRKVPYTLLNKVLPCFLRFFDLKGLSR